MPYVWMDEIPKAQTISENGIGFYPDDTAKEKAVVDEDGRSVRKTPSPYDVLGMNPGSSGGSGGGSDVPISV